MEFSDGKGAPVAENDDAESMNNDRESGEFIFCTSFWHKAAGRRIYAAPGKAFKFRVKS